MNPAKFLFLSLLILLSACYGEVDPDNEVHYDSKTYPLANELSESSYSNGDARLTFSYTGDRVKEVSLKNDTKEWVYLTVNYLNDEESRIRSVYYSYGTHLSDTLLYTGNNLVKIISTFQAEDTEGETGRYTTETNFTYGLLGRLQEAYNGSRKVEFMDHQGFNATRIKYYQPNLWLDIQSIRYDAQPSPFGKLGYLNLILFANNNLEGLSYLGSHNITEYIEIDDQGWVYRKYEFDYSYDAKGRPVWSAMRRSDKTTYKKEDFYHYNN
jgi:hypothetical protein